MPCFNPHPARRPDAIRAAVELWRAVLVSILIRPEGRMQSGQPSSYGGRCWFQSSSGQKAGCNPSPPGSFRRGRCFNPHPARRPDAMRHVAAPSDVPKFQSSSGQKAGCNHRSRWTPQPGGRRFNPHPARRPDAILPALRYNQRVRGVSILIRPEGRMQSHGIQNLTAAACGFNPHPARRPDAMCPGEGIASSVSVSILIRPEGRMQYQRLRRRSRRGNVSILIRPEGRMQYDGPAWHEASHPFQSSSGQKAGCNSRQNAPPGQLVRFQSSSGQKAGCNAIAFPGCPTPVAVSILIRPEGRMQSAWPQ